MSKEAKFNYDEFAEQFKKCLKYGDSLRSIAPKVGVSVATLSRALKGGNMDLKTALRMADYAKISIYQFWR